PHPLWLVPALACFWILAASGWATWLDQQALNSLVDGDRYAARDALRTAVTLAPWDADLHADLAVPLAMLRDPLGAPGDLREAIRRAPTSPAFHFRLGRAWEALGDSRHAIRAFEAATSWAPTGTQGWLALGEARERAGDTAGALADYRRIAELEK